MVTFYQFIQIVILTKKRAAKKIKEPCLYMWQGWHWGPEMNILVLQSYYVLVLSQADNFSTRLKN